MDRNNKFEDYKRSLENHKGVISALRKEVELIVSERHLNPVMNDTKWLELQNAIGLLLFPPPYIVKCITDNDDAPIGFLEEVPEYYGDWSGFDEEGLPPFFNIEWMKISPRYGKHQGRLVSKEIIDVTTGLLEIFRKYSIPFEEENKNFIIYGYR